MPATSACKSENHYLNGKVFCILTNKQTKNERIPKLIHTPKHTHVHIQISHNTLFKLLPHKATYDWVCKRNFCVVICFFLQKFGFHHKFSHRILCVWMRNVHTYAISVRPRINHHTVHMANLNKRTPHA